MHFFLLEKLEEGVRAARTDSMSDECRRRLADNDTKCLSHYGRRFSDSLEPTVKFVKCPYGFWTSSVLHEVVPPLLVSGITSAVSTGAAEAPDSIGASVARAIDYAATAVHRKEYEHLEAALHDVRELNRAITGQAEGLLAEHGFVQGREWDLQVINADSTLRRAFSIFCGTRDLRAALDLHELWRDPRNAANTKTRVQMHKHFFRQKQIVAEQLAQKQLTLQLGHTNAEMTLTESFLLIPKILIDNAIKYSKPNSTIRIEFIESGNTFRIIARNTGRLIKQAERQNVFRRGYRGANSSGVSGSGIGLWLASIIADTNGGVISLDVDENERTPQGSSHGETTVTLRLVRQFPPQ